MKKEELKEEIKEEVKEEVKVESTENTENIEKVENEPVKVNISQRLTKSKEGFFSKLKNIKVKPGRTKLQPREKTTILIIQKK